MARFGRSFPIPNKVHNLALLVYAGTGTGITSLTGVATGNSFGSGAVSITATATYSVALNDSPNGTISLNGSGNGGPNFPFNQDNTTGNISISGIAIGNITANGSITLAETGTTSTVSISGTGSPALTLTGNATGNTNDNGSGNLSLTSIVTGTPSISDSGSGSTTLLGVVAGSTADSGTGSFTIIANATNGFSISNTGSGSITLSENSPSSNYSVSGIITLSENATGTTLNTGTDALSIVATTSGGNYITGSGVISFTESGGGNIRGSAPSLISIVANCVGSPIATGSQSTSFLGTLIGGNNYAGYITLSSSGSGSGNFAVTPAASIAIIGSGIEGNTGSGSISITETGTGNPHIAVTFFGAINLTGIGTGSPTDLSTGAIAIVGSVTGTPSVKTTGTAILTLSESNSGFAPNISNTGIGAISFVGNSGILSTANGLISISATATNLNSVHGAIALNGLASASGTASGTILVVSNITIQDSGLATINLTAGGIYTDIYGSPIITINIIGTASGSISLSNITKATGNSNGYIKFIATAAMVPNINANGIDTYIDSYTNLYSAFTPSANINLLLTTTFVLNSVHLGAGNVTITANINSFTTGASNAGINITANIIQNTIGFKNIANGLFNISAAVVGTTNIQNSYIRAPGFPVSATSTGQTSITFTTSTLQDLVILYIYNPAGFAPNSVSCSKTGTWTLLDSYNSVNNNNISVWTALVTAIGSTTATATWPSSISNATVEFVVDEIQAISFPVNNAPSVITGTGPYPPGTLLSTTNGTWNNVDNFSWIIFQPSNTSSISTSAINFPTLTAPKVGGFYSGYAVVAGTVSGDSTAGFVYTITNDADVLVLENALAPNVVYTPTATQSSGKLSAVALNGYAIDGIHTGSINIFATIANPISVVNASISLIGNASITGNLNGSINLVSNVTNKFSIKGTGTGLVALSGIVSPNLRALGSINLASVPTTAILQSISGGSPAFINITANILLFNGATINIVANAIGFPGDSDAVSGFISFQEGASGVPNFSINGSALIEIDASAYGLSGYTPETGVTGAITITGFVSNFSTQSPNYAIDNIFLLATVDPTFTTISVIDELIGQINVFVNGGGFSGSTASATISLNTVLGSTPNGTATAYITIIGTTPNTVYTNGSASVSVISYSNSAGLAKGNVSLINNCAGRVLGKAPATISYLGNVVVTQFSGSGVAKINLLNNGTGHTNNSARGQIAFSGLLNVAFNEAIILNGHIVLTAFLESQSDTLAPAILILNANAIGLFHIRPSRRIIYDEIKPGATLYPLPLVPNNL